MCCLMKACVLITNKTLKMFLTSNHCFHQKYESSIHNIAFSSEKALSSELGEKYEQIKHRLHAKTAVNKYVCVMWEDNRWWSSLEQASLWILDLARWDVLKLKCLDEFVSYKYTAFHIIKYQLINWSGVDYCDVFISCLDSHSDGTHSLQRIHCWATFL